jgi:hypothetical protein
MQNGQKDVFSQAERSFFNMRYAVPGFTFILISILTSYPTLKDILFPIADATLVAAFLAFFSLLGGGAIGFLVSQVWHLVDFWLFYGNYGKFRKLREDLKTEYHLSDDRLEQVFRMDNLFNSLSERRIQIYAQRRYDLMHTCGSTLIATILGYALGILIRIHIFSTHTSLEQIETVLVNMRELVKNAQMYDVAVFLIFIFLLVVIGLGLRRVMIEHARVVDFAVREIMRTQKLPLERECNSQCHVCEGKKKD